MPSFGRIGMDPEVLELGHRLAAAMESLAEEIREYNRPGTVVKRDDVATFTIPPKAGDFMYGEGGLLHQIPGQEIHLHEEMSELMECLDEKGLLG